jgi:hypothetical protein
MRYSVVLLFRADRAATRPTVRSEYRSKQALLEAGATGLEPATSGVTGRRSNQLSYAPVRGERQVCQDGGEKRWRGR